MRRVLRLSALIALAAGPWLGGCSNGPNLLPTFTLTSPTDGSTNASTDIAVSVAIGGLTLTNIVYPIGDSTDPIPFYGHWELYVDGQPVNGSQQPGAPAPANAYPPGANFLGDEFGTSVVILGLSTGEHLVQGQLVNENHAPIFGVQPFGALVTIPSGAPALAISAPAAGASINSSSVGLGLTLANFTLTSAGVGGTNVAGQGHYHVYLDGLGPDNDLGEDWTLSPTVSRLPVSATVTSNLLLTVRLANNDESLVDPPVLAMTTLTLPAGAPGILLTQPGRGATVGTALTVSVAVTDFNLRSPPVGTTSDTMGFGHWTLLVDGAKVTSSGTLSIGPIGLSSGGHLVQAELRGDLDDPLSPPVVDFARVLVP